MDKGMPSFKLLKAANDFLKQETEQNKNNRCDSTVVFHGQTPPKKNLWLLLTDMLATKEHTA